MASHVFLALSRPSEGRADEFHRWYDAHHLQDVVDLCPGFVTGHRYFAEDAERAAPAWPSLAVYRLESDDLDVLHRSVSASAARFTPSGGVFAPDHAAWVYSAAPSDDQALRDWLARPEQGSFTLAFYDAVVDDDATGDADRSPLLERASGQRAGEHPTWRYLRLSRGTGSAPQMAGVAAAWTYAPHGKGVETATRSA